MRRIRGAAAASRTWPWVDRLASVRAESIVSIKRSSSKGLVTAGTYHEQVAITGKNNTTGASEADRIVIQADPGAPRESVVVTPPAAPCINGEALRFRPSKVLTPRGLTLPGAPSRAPL